MKRAPLGALQRGSDDVLKRRDLRRLRALVALDDLEADALTLGQRLVAIHRDRREVDEDVLPTRALDEAIALLVRKPLHGALWQNRPPTYKRRHGHRAADH